MVEGVNSMLVGAPGYWGLGFYMLWATYSIFYIHACVGSVPRSALRPWNCRTGSPFFLIIRKCLLNKLNQPLLQRRSSVRNLSVFLSSLRCLKKYFLLISSDYIFKYLCHFKANVIKKAKPIRRNIL